MMTRGGGWFDHNELSPQRALKYEIDKQVNNGRNPSVTKRHVHALAFGGLTDAEFYELIRDRACAPYGTAHDLWDVDDVPKDRWFRNAWRRSPNGGPIEIDLEKARPIQAAHIDRAVNRIKRPKNVLTYLLPQSPPRKFNLKHLASRIREARDEFELRSIWPDNFSGFLNS